MDKRMSEYIPESLSIWFTPLWMYSVETDVFLIILGLVTEHLNPNPISQPLPREVKHSNSLHVYLTALSNVVLIKLGYIKNSKSLYIKLP